MKQKKYVIFFTIVAALGGFLFGFDTAVISGTTEWLQKIYNLSSFWLGFTVASALIGTVVGSIAVGKRSDKHGLLLLGELVRQNKFCKNAIQIAEILTWKLMI